MQPKDSFREEQHTDRVSAPRLLVVDDDLIQRTIISTIATQVGWESQCASSFKEADLMLRANTYDRVTLDLSLGEHSGSELLRRIAATGSASVIVISGCEERVLTSTVRLAGALGIASCHIPKPLELTELRRRLIENRLTESRTQKARVATQAIEVSELALALEHDEIVPWFQPKIELATGNVVGCEALARWRHPTSGWIAPDIFVPLAESSGLMPLLTSRLLCAATRLVLPIVDYFPAFSVAVNVSASLLSDLSLADQIDLALVESGLPARALTVEITESAVMYDTAKAADILIGLRVKGVGVAIDDFGTGYSSLAALARMPFSELKIDHVFVRESATDRDMARVVRACVRLGHELDMKVVAEGIETVASWNRLSEMGCDIGQGLIFAAALDAAQLPTWIDQWRSHNGISGLRPATVG